MDRILDWLSTEFPPGWFDGMEVATDWVAVAGLGVAVFFGAKALTPQRKTKISLTLDLRETLTHDGKDGYRRLIVHNDGHFPAQGITVNLDPDSPPRHKHTFRGEDLAPGQVEYTGLALRGFEGMTLPVTYRDANNKLAKTRIKVAKGYVYSGAEEKEIVHWVDKGRSSSSIIGKRD